MRAVGLVRFLPDLEPLADFVFVDAPPLAAGDYGWWHAANDDPASISRFESSSRSVHSGTTLTTCAPRGATSSECSITSYEGSRLQRAP